MLIAAVNPPHTGLGNVDFVVVGLYLIGTLGIALYFARQHGSTEEFFLGGRRMPWFAVGLSIMATLLSTITYLSMPGETIKHGITAMMAVLSIPFSVAVIFWLIVPFFMRLHMTSAYEFLELRFNYPARLLAAVLFTLLRLGWMGVVVYTSSLAVSAMTGYSIEQLIIVVGTFATIYTTVGGIRAVIWTDVVQSLTLLVGAIVTVSYIAYVTGTGPETWWASARSLRAEHTNPILFSLDVTTQRTVLTFMIHSFFWTVCTHSSDQVVLQRYFSTSSAKAAKRSYLLSEGVNVCMGLLLALCGLALLYFYTAHPNFLHDGTITPAGASDKVFPYFIAHQLPPGLGGLILAALIAAAMSSIDSGINSVSTVVTTDVFQRLYPEGGKWVTGVAMARTLTLVVGALATALGYWVAWISKDINIMELMPKGFNMFLGPLGALFFIGMFLPRCTARSAIPAVLAGMAFAVAWSYWPEITGTDPKHAPTFTLAIAGPCMTSVLLAAILSRLVDPPVHAGREYTWWAVMRRNPETGERSDGLRT